MTSRPDERALFSPLGDNSNPKAGQYLTRSFKAWDEVGDFLNDARVNIRLEHVCWVNAKFNCLFLVDASVKIKRKRKSKKGASNG